MPLAFPEPRRDVLANSPLTLVACQVSFENNLAVSENAVARAFHEALGGRRGRFPKSESVMGRTINVNIAGGEPSLSQQTPQVGWRFSGEDEQVALLATHVLVETSRYTNWPSFRSAVSDAVGAVIETIDPIWEERVGLRYINRLRDWSEAVDARLLGALAHPDLLEGVVLTRHQVILDLEEHTRCIMNHGATPPAAEGEMPTYLLDIDVAREDRRAFDRGQIEATLDRLNTWALGLFQSVVNEQFLQESTAEEVSVDA